MRTVTALYMSNTPCAGAMPCACTLLPQYDFLPAGGDGHRPAVTGVGQGPVFAMLLFVIPPGALGSDVQHKGDQKAPPMADKSGGCFFISATPDNQENRNLVIHG